MNNPNATPREIEMYKPKRLNDFIGCEKLKSVLVDQLRLHGDGTNILLLGDTGTAKTSFIECYIRTRNCPHVKDPATGPCGKCTACCEFRFLYPDEGIFAKGRQRAAGDNMDTHFFPVDGYSLNENSLEELRCKISDYQDDRIIVHIDEIQAIGESRVSGMLLSMVRELKAIWIASGVSDEKLSPMLVMRFANRCKTEKPTSEQIGLFTRKRCEEWGIQWDTLKTISILSVKCKGITSNCLNVLARAASTKDRALTRELVENHNYISGVNS